jgi:hypothetical protein
VRADERLGGGYRSQGTWPRPATPIGTTRARPGISPPTDAPQPSPSCRAELRHIGGALGRAGESAGALAKLDADFLMSGVGLPMTLQLGEAIDAHLDHLGDVMAPWTAEGGYFNFAERPCGIDAILPAETHARLLEIKQRWDPDGMISANHEVAVA